MSKIDALLQQLKKQGSRITKSRSLIVGIFQKHPLPLTELAVREMLSKAGMKVNKTTVYRELEHLISKAVVKPIEFGDGKKRYELNAGHHHHLV